MQSAQPWSTISNSADQTVKLAAQIGNKMRGGEVIELTSDLGGGKTTFVRGLAQGMGSLDTVHSPSFTLSNEYNANGLTLYHFDFYRLAEAGIMRNEVAELLSDPKAVVVVEWADIIDDVLPAKRLTVALHVTDQTSRRIDIRYPESLKYALPANT